MLGCDLLTKNHQKGRQAWMIQPQEDSPLKLRPCYYDGSSSGVSGCDTFSVIDLRQDYHHIPIKVEDQEKTALLLVIGSLSGCVCSFICTELVSLWPQLCQKFCLIVAVLRELIIMNVLQLLEVESKIYKIYRKNFRN